MARKGKYGRYILSANEIGGYIVCPESWRLKVIERVRSQHTERASAGRKLHDEWAKQYDESLYLARSARLVVMLLLMAISIYLIVRGL